MFDYTPPPRLRGGHRMTIYTWARPRRFPRLSAAETRFFDVAPDARVLAHCHWQPDRREAPTLLALHGLEGSSEAHYMRGLADKAFARGFNVVRLNQRNCGDTDHLSRGLYHSGLANDPLAVIAELVAVDGLPSIAVAGYSLGGNVALRLAGEVARTGSGAGGDPGVVRAVCAVSPTVNLERCVEALERRENLLYEWNFVRNLKRRMRRKIRLYPDLYSPAMLRRVRTVRAFDEYYTAPCHGFEGASDYYYRASALRVAERIGVPTLIVSAADDPFVPPDQFDDPAIRNNPNITVLITPHGGHCAFLAESSNGFDGYWAERKVIEFVEGVVGSK